MNVWDDLERVLTDERQLLLDGRIGDLPGLAERKVALLSGLGPDPSGAPPRIVEMAEANGRLLEAAGRGLKSALRRIEEAKGAGTTRTYDGRGRVQALSGQMPGRGTRV